MDQKKNKSERTFVIDHAPNNLFTSDVDWKQKGYRMKSISGYGSKNSLFAAIWDDQNGHDYTFTTDMTPSEFQKVFDNLEDNGYVPHYIDGYDVNNKVMYAAIWEKLNSGDYLSRFGSNPNQFHNICIEFSSRGFRPIHVSVYHNMGELNYAGIWKKNTGTESTLRHELLEDSFKEFHSEFEGQGYRLIDLNASCLNGSPKFAAIWENSNSVTTRHDTKVPAEEFEKRNQIYQDMGFIAATICGYEIDKQTYFAVIWEKPNK